MRQFLRIVVGFSLLGCFNNAAGAQEIRIGQPKAWRYDRMFPVEDGLLRDVEGIGLNSLTGLDASELNSRVVDLLQTYVSASVNFDQTAGIQNAIAMDAFKATRNSQLNQLKDQATSSQALADQKAQIIKNLADAIAAQGKACPGAGCQDAQNQVSNLNAQLKAVNDAINAAGLPANFTPPPAPSVTPVSGGTPITTPALTPLISGADFMKNALTADQRNLVGSLPARERLQSFITLLNDRLTHQLALSLDERGLSKDYVPVVLQLDVAIEPNSNRKEQKAVSEFKISAPGCNAHTGAPETPIVYNLYPALGAFNVSEVQGQSTGFYANGGFKGLVMGSNLSFQRQHDHITSAMAQSVYISGFRVNDDTFGWYYGAPAYSKLVRPGIYTTFAVVLIPKAPGGVQGSGSAQGEDSLCKIQLDATAHWEKKNGKRSDAIPFNNLVDSTKEALVPDNHPPRVQAVQYWPKYGQKSDLQKVDNVIAIEFEQPVDPNLLITASGKLLKRVRDWRGRATAPASSEKVTVKDSAGTDHEVSTGRGLLETNYDEADTWIAVSQKRILIKLSFATAGFLDFPAIRLLIPGSGDMDLRDAINYFSYASKISIGDRTFYGCHPKLSVYDPAKGNEGCMQQPNSLWLPLFLETPEKTHRLRVTKVHAVLGDERSGISAMAPRKESPVNFVDVALKTSPKNEDSAPIDDASQIEADLDAPDNSKNGQQQYIFLSLDDGRIKLSGGAQVLLVAPAHSRFARPIAIECASLGNGLLCHLHPQTITFNSPQSLERLISADSPNAPCLVKQSEGLPVISKSRYCNWENYRLQVVVTQSGSESGMPTVLASADFPTGDLTLPVIGPVRTAQQRDSGEWVLEFPVWYGRKFVRENLCVGDGTGKMQGVTASLEPNPLGDPRRASSLIVNVPASKISRFVFSGLYLYGRNCPTSAERPGWQLGALSGVDRVVLPDGILLTRAGTGNSFYQFTGTNTEKVKALAFSNHPEAVVTPKSVRGGFVADLSLKTKTAEEVLVYFDLGGGFQVPVIACWNTDPASSQICGQVVIKTTAAGPVTIAPLSVENKTSSAKAPVEAPSSKVSVRPD